MEQDENIEHREVEISDFARSGGISKVDLTLETIKNGVNHTYKTLDAIDKTLLSNGSGRMTEIVELAGFSSMLGDLLTSGIANASDGVFERNTPHSFPDLLHQSNEERGLEVKVALENNNPKGHLIKPGYYITFRYVLAEEDKKYDRDERGNIPYIWEIRFGYLDDTCFNKSDTEGDSGKTAVIHSDAIDEMDLLLCDFDIFPYSKSKKGRKYPKYVKDIHGEEPSYYD